MLHEFSIFPSHYLFNRMYLTLRVLSLSTCFWSLMYTCCASLKREDDPHLSKYTYVVMAGISSFLSFFDFVYYSFLYLELKETYLISATLMISVSFFFFLIKP
jgi:hypothetical protein